MIKSLEYLDRVMTRIGAEVRKDVNGTLIERVYVLGVRRATVYCPTPKNNGGFLPRKVVIDVGNSQGVTQYCHFTRSVLGVVNSLVGSHTKFDCVSKTTGAEVRCRAFTTSQGLVELEFRIVEGEMIIYEIRHVTIKDRELYQLLIGYRQGSVPVSLVLDFLEDFHGLNREILK